MKNFRSVAVWFVAVGLSVGTAAMAPAQQTTGQNDTGVLTRPKMAPLGDREAPPGAPAQTGSTQPSAQSGLGPLMSGSGADDPSVFARTAQDQEKMRNIDRQKKLVSDTDRLLSLATELKTDMDKTNKDMLSLDVVRKAEEIEKLAHSVKERMKGQ